MATETKNYLVRCDKATAERLTTELKKITGAAPKENEIKGIGGEAELILYGTAAFGALKAFFELLKAIIEAGRAIKGVKVGDHELNNPKVSDISELEKKVGV
jgi:hypothetical protein